MSLFESLQVRLAQGHQTIADPRTAVPVGHRGLPVIDGRPCSAGCDACVRACPTAAVTLDPVVIDLGRCVFCADCAAACPDEKISFTPEPKMGATARDSLLRREGETGPMRVPSTTAVREMFGRSLRMRQVSAGGCNACELELNATANVNFDLSRYGIEWVASPRHADALVLTGPLTRNMAEAIELSWQAMPEPRFLVAVGACCISGGLYDGGHGVARSFLERVGPALFVPGCPPHPLTFVNAVLDFLGVV